MEMVSPEGVVKLSFTKADFNVLVYMYYISKLIEINLTYFLLIRTVSLLLDDFRYLLFERLNSFLKNFRLPMSEYLGDPVA